MLHLVLIRGLPGSGKSTRAKREYPNFVHIENDMFLMEDGQYVFTNKRRKNAVKACIEATENALKQGKSVVVSNCFLRHESMLPYTWLASGMELMLMFKLQQAISIPFTTFPRT